MYVLGSSGRMVQLTCTCMYLQLCQQQGGRFLSGKTSFNRLYAEFTRTPEHRNAKFIFKRNHVAAASQQKQVLVRLTGILQALLIYEKRVELLMELMS